VIRNAALPFEVHARLPGAVCSWLREERDVYSTAYPSIDLAPLGAGLLLDYITLKELSGAFK